jgi:3-hydroxyacyl-CoA dehydrogenase
VALDKLERRIAIVGTGVIGSSWAAQYLVRGFDVIATDPPYLDLLEVPMCD